MLIEAGKPGGLNLGLLFAALIELRLGNHLQVRSALDLVLPALEFFVVAQPWWECFLPLGSWWWLPSPTSLLAADAVAAWW